MSSKQSIGVLGATSLVGQTLLPRLVQGGCSVTAFSRNDNIERNNGVDWQQIVYTPLPHKTLSEVERRVPFWICVAPIWVLPQHFSLLEAYGVRRIVALSSTSRFTKDKSSDPEEQEVACRLAQAEEELQTWAEQHGVAWVILRPTLIYGLGRDKNIAYMARFIRRFGFFPLFGEAGGLRQPIHAADVAEACVAALIQRHIGGRSYNISGGETIAYREMVMRIFATMGLTARPLPVPLWVFRVAVALMRWLPRYRHWSAAMAERMNRDQVFDQSDALRDLALKPRSFALTEEDVLG